MPAASTRLQNGSNSGSASERRPHQDGARAAREHPLELLHGALDDRQRDDRRREDAALVVEAPRLVHPLVQRMDHRVGRQRVVGEPLLDQARERGPHHGAVEAELVHQREPGRRLEERRQRLDRTAEDLAPRLPARISRLEVVLLRAGCRHHFEGRVRDVVADLALHRDLRAPLHLHVLDHARVRLGQVPRQRLGRLVHVVVGVEDREVEATGHGGFSTKAPAQRTAIESARPPRRPSARAGPPRPGRLGRGRAAQRGSDARQSARMRVSSSSFTGFTR